MVDEKKIDKGFEYSHCCFCGSARVNKVGRKYYPDKTYKQLYRCMICKKYMLGKLRANIYFEREIPKQIIKKQESQESEFEYESKKPDKRYWQIITTAQNEEIKMTYELLKALMDRIEIKTNKKVGRPTMDPKEMLFIMIIKTISIMSSRRLKSNLEFAKELGFISKVPSFSTIMRYFNKPAMTILLDSLLTISILPVENDGDIESGIDSTGFSVSKYGCWLDYRWGKEQKQKRVFRKLHIVGDMKTHCILSAQVTENFGEGSGDISQFVPLLKKAMDSFDIKIITADKAYSGRDEVSFASKNGITPYIDFRYRSKGKAKGSLAWSKMYLLWQKNPQEFYRHYHKRSNVETIFNMVKSKYSSSLFTKKFIANKNEILCKILCHNLSCVIYQFFKLNIDLNYDTGIIPCVAF